jgi:hypothetical protein
MPIPEENPWSILVDAKRDGVQDFQAIQAALALSISSQGWTVYNSTTIGIDSTSKLVGGFVGGHAMIPYIGRSIQSSEPIACVDATATHEEVEIWCKLAYWENGAVYYETRMINGETQTDKEYYLLLIDKKTRNIYKYPEPEELTNG